MYITRFACQVLNNLEFSRQIFQKYSNIEFRETPSSGGRDVPCGQRDRYDEGNSRFLKFLRRRLIKIRRRACRFPISWAWRDFSSHADIWKITFYPMLNWNDKFVFKSKSAVTSQVIWKYMDLQTLWLRVPICDSWIPHSDDKVRKFIAVSFEVHPTKRTCHKAKEGRCQNVSDCSYLLIQWLYWITTVHLLRDLLASLWNTGTVAEILRLPSTGRLNRISRDKRREKTKTDRRNSRCFLDVSWDKNSLIGSVTAACVWAPDGFRTEKKGMD